MGFLSLSVAQSARVAVRSLAEFTAPSTQAAVSEEALPEAVAPARSPSPHGLALQSRGKLGPKLHPAPERQAPPTLLQEAQEVTSAEASKGWANATAAGASSSPSAANASAPAPAATNSSQEAAASVGSTLAAAAATQPAAVTSSNATVTGAAEGREPAALSTAARAEAARGATLVNSSAQQGEAPPSPVPPTDSLAADDAAMRPVTVLQRLADQLGAELRRGCLASSTGERLGCEVECRCGWSEQCYPKYILVGGEPHQGRDPLEWVKARVNVGVCGTAMPVLMFLSSTLFATLLGCVVAVRVFSVAPIDDDERNADGAWKGPVLKIMVPPSSEPLSPKSSRSSPVNIGHANPVFFGASSPSPSPTASAATFPQSPVTPKDPPKDSSGAGGIWAHLMSASSKATSSNQNFFPSPRVPET